MGLVLTLAAFAAVALMLSAAVTDAASMTIPNKIPAALTLLFLIAALAGPLPAGLSAWHVGVGAAVFAVSLALFAAGIFGGGDAKFLPAVALWMGPAAVLPFLAHTAVLGGVMALALIVIRRAPVPAGAPGWVARLMDRHNGIPYGIAIAGGAIVAGGQSPFLAAVFG